VRDHLCGEGGADAVESPPVLDLRRGRQVVQVMAVEFRREPGGLTVYGGGWVERVTTPTMPLDPLSFHR
jgi:hypothetical protein